MNNYVWLLLLVVLLWFTCAKREREGKQNDMKEDYND